MMADRNINGISTNPESLKQSALQDEKLFQHQQFNGVHSSQSSRSSSPGVRLGHISSQLPPRLIPQSQLPPVRPSIGNVTQQIGGINLNQSLPRSSPQFGTPTFSQSQSSTMGQKATPSPITVNTYFNKDTGSSIGSTASQQSLSGSFPVPPQIQPNLVQSNAFSVNPQSSSNLGQKSDSFPPLQGQFPNVQQNNTSQPPKPFHLPNPAPTRTVSGIGSLPSPQNKVLTNQNADLSRTHPTQSQHSMGVPYNSSLAARVSPIPPQQNFQISPNRNGPIQAPPSQGQINSQFGQSRNVVPGSHFQTTVSQQNLQKTYPQQPSLVQNNDNQRINGPNSFQNFNNGPNNNANLPTTPSTLSTQTTNYQQVNNSGVPPLTPPNVAQKANLHSNRYPTLSVNNYQQPTVTPGQYSYQQPVQKQAVPQQQSMNSYPNQNNQGGVLQTGFNKYWGMEHFDLLQIPNILPPAKEEAPLVQLGQELLDEANCSPDLFRCTMTKIPENNSLLQKSRLPLGVLIHPFRDLSHLPVIQCNVIVRCRACRTYINPFVMFVDNKRWKCNLCYRINELPEEFQYDPVTKTYGDPSRRPEIKSSTLEYIAPAEYMLRPPQPAVYLYLLDVSRLAVESGYLKIVSNILLEELKNIPGDARTQIGFIAYDSALHFYSLPEGITQPHEMTILDIDDVFLPTPDNLLVNLKDRMDLIADLLRLLPNRFANTFDTNSALGAALQVAFKMMSPTGGRVTVFQAALPNIGPGALVAREDPSSRAATEVAHLNPANDFYKRLALECSGQQIAVDLFVVNSQYVDIATISGISRFSGGAIHHFPLLRPARATLCENFTRSFRRYVARKIGFEAVMRIRCTRGLSIHTFHGNFFVRSTDLLSLPNINPDAGFGMQVAIEESLSDVQTVCFQAALLYTSSKGERRIRVHTMCLPVVSTLHEIIHSADQQCIIGLLSKMAVDRSMQSSLADAREAFINVAIDILSSYKVSLNLGSPVTGLLVPNCLKLLPLYISALLKHTAFRTGTSTRLDDRVMKMIEMKTKPLYMLMQDIYPDLYPIHQLENQEVIMNSEEEPVSVPPRIQLTARCLDNKGAFLMDLGEHMVILVCPNVSQEFLNEALGVPNYPAIPDDCYEIPVLDNLRNQRLHQFISYLNEDKPFAATLQVIRDNSTNRVVFFERLIEDRVENALSYHEFLQHLKTQVK
ncbi:unnamed protein product [Psylliodes chrysocephalus]|uniref:Protein transport protein Sec24A n=1 Tax=Psylliodes chrysocephalus TaxID=3402493 RepID=A0A9P0G5F2_9CUCU|nr:unnamed protein product [Psylliodes chrysocephala]